mmetsp:Transcript_5466/g.12466  ORF Transcript_5466/g.12466 Transcript_5466/m.12466 type:complete len:119 (-) Transcript_5466:37-393(-)
MQVRIAQVKIRNVAIAANRDPIRLVRWLASLLIGIMFLLVSLLSPASFMSTMERMDPLETDFGIAWSVWQFIIKRTGSVVASDFCMFKNIEYVVYYRRVIGLSPFRIYQMMKQAEINP